MRELLVAWKDAAPAAGVLTALVSASVALLVLFYTKAANRRRATLDMVMKTLLDESAQKKEAEFKALIIREEDSSDSFKLIALLDDSMKGSSERKAMLHQLNVYELMALGIRRKIFDEAFYKRWYHNQFMKDYESSISFITGLQKKKTTIYCECSALYSKWVKDGHPELSPGRLKMAFWGLTNQNGKIDQALTARKAR